ncbi:MAG: hypothetical protein IKY21_01840 [Clostridia bacterium]|nr:hypothetical protein [Clostridia bacterium]
MIKYILIKKILKIALTVLAALLSLVIVVWGALNILKFAIYSDYYSIESTLCDNPGLSDGFVCQGICALENEGKIFVSGYMTDKSASRIYVTDYESNSYFVNLSLENGKAFTGHAGGIAVWGDRVYIANGSKLYFASAKSILNSKDGDSVTITVGAEVNNSASFVFADEEHVYVGEFHDGGAYITDHPYETKNGTQYAIVSKYTHNDLTAPVRIYSIPDKVQGMCITDSGKIIFSTSYGLTDSEYLVYEEDSARDSGLTLDGASVYLLEDRIKQISGPAMGEELDFSNGKAITLTESASDKYIFGKFFFANDIVALDFESALEE